MLSPKVVLLLGEFGQIGLRWVTRRGKGIGRSARVEGYPILRLGHCSVTALSKRKSARDEARKSYGSVDDYDESMMVTARSSDVVEKVHCVLQSEIVETLIYAIA